MPVGRGGMGSHKHGVSGHNGPSPRQKQNLSRDANREMELEREQKRKRENANPKFGSMQELLASRKTR